MTNITSAPAREMNSAEYEDAADQLLMEMERLNSGMQKDRQEIERLKADTSRLEAENRVVLTRLKAMW